MSNLFERKAMSSGISKFQEVSDHCSYPQHLECSS